jgi:hypothetical protein
VAASDLTDLALHLTEHIIPSVPVRQFVLSILTA